MQSSNHTGRLAFIFLVVSLQRASTFQAISCISSQSHTPCQAFVDPAWHDQCQTPVEACTLLFSLSETVLEAIVAVWIWHTSDGTPSFGHALLAHAVCKCLAVGKMVGNPGEKKRRNRVLTDHHLPQKHKIAVSIRHVKSSRARGSMMAPLRDILAEEAAMFRIRRSMHI